MSTNSLGDFEFVTFHHPEDHGAPPLLPARMGQVIQRAGADGSTVLQLGRKGRPFPMRSGVDVATFAEANDLLRDYMDAANEKPLGLIWGGANFGTAYGVQYIPVDVQPIRIRRISGVVGGLSGQPNCFWLEALWTLLPVETITFDD